METLGLDRLSPDERVRLAEELWESIADDPGAITLTDAQRQDLRRRVDAFADNPKAGTPWEQVKARLLKRGEG
jgi:putative addiction module component (TIGR02574 family)